MASKALNICLSIVRWAPVIFITAIIVWSYYAYVIQMCIFTITNIPEKVIYLVLYHPLLFMFGWAYWKTTFVELGKVPKEFFLSSVDLEQFDRAENEALQRDILARAARNLPLQCRTNSGAVRYCEKCKCIKPDRAHHCSVCGICVLKMDHHCPWVNSCVCFFNYKFFVLFLGYALLYCLFVAATSLQYFIKFWSLLLYPMINQHAVANGADGWFATKNASADGMGKFHILFLFFAAVMFCVSLVSLFGYHLYLATLNRSTLESFRAPVFSSGPDKDGFSLGRTSNFIEIFGEDKRYWFLPIFTSLGDGVSYPTRVTPTQSNYHSMETTEQSPTQPSYGDGVTFPIRTIDEDYDSLLGQRQRWMEEGDIDTADAYSNQVATQKNSVFTQSEDE